MATSDSNGRPDRGPARRLVGRVRWSDALALLAILATVALGVLAAGSLPDRLVVHWSLGYESAYWGIRTLPKAIALALGPAAAVATHVLLRGVGVLLGDDIAPVRTAYEALLVASVLGACGLQVAVIAANLL